MINRGAASEIEVITKGKQETPSIQIILGQGCSSVADHLLSMQEVLGSNPNTKENLTLEDPIVTYHIES